MYPMLATNYSSPSAATAEGTTNIRATAASRKPTAASAGARARAEELRHSVADLTRARAVLGYAPTTDLEARVDEVIASVRGSS